MRAPGGEGFAATKRVVQDLGLHTVCEEAHCPNVAECWGHRTATFMLLGDVCTRNCGYCAVAHGKPVAVDPHEPERVAEGVARLGLRHVVVTSVDRDDLPDGGAGALRRHRARHQAPRARLRRRGAHAGLQRRPRRAGAGRRRADRRLQPQHRDRAAPLPPRPPGRQLRPRPRLLRAAKRRRPALLTKTGLMLGLGEERDEVVAVLRDLADVGCDILTLGQYLQPTRDHLPIERYLPPATSSPSCAPIAARAGLPPRRVRPAGAQLVPRLGARRLTRDRALAASVPKHPETDAHRRPRRGSSERLAR